MLWKVLAVIALVALPFSLSFWYRSHKHPAQYRYDVTLYKSLRVKLKDGVCGMQLLSMPTKVGSRSEFRSQLEFDAAPGGRTFLLNSHKQGPYRFTRLAFPFWFPTLVLVVFGAIPIVQGPIRRWWRHIHGRCLECGYDLRGNRSGRCSECGTRYR